MSEHLSNTMSEPLVGTPTMSEQFVCRVYYMMDGPTAVVSQYQILS
jgi:hypothetical protein